MRNITICLIISLLFLILMTACTVNKNQNEINVLESFDKETISENFNPDSDIISSNSDSTLSDINTETEFTEICDTELYISDDAADVVKIYENTGFFELPINGVTGYASVKINLMKESRHKAPIVQSINAGTSFKILKEEGDFWFVETNAVSGWVEHKYCLINLPSIIPSIIYDNTNTYSSKFMSSDKFIPGITGETLYNAKAYNHRLNKDEYIMLILYSTAKKIQTAQQYALTEGNSLKIYEAFRPYNTQQTVFNALTKLAYNDINVMEGISSSPWKINWFIAEGISNHQRGYAIDVSLVKIDSTKELFSGKYSYFEITSYTEYVMPTQIHELSIAAATFTYPISTVSSEWQNAVLSNTMNDAAKLLQKYCTTAGLTPLASEWWHFNDINAMNEISKNPGNGNFNITECYCTIPETF